MAEDLTLALVSTMRHDGDGGVADDLRDAERLTAWVREHAAPLGGSTGRPCAVYTDFTADDDAVAQVVAVRAAVRALFARAVSPAPPSPADADRLMPADQAIDVVNAAAARRPVTPVLAWPEDGAPAALLAADGGEPIDLLVAALARAAIAFLTGPRRERLRACTAPRCVRYFVKEHGKQEWCKPSCGNRARVARHYQRVRAGDMG